MKLSQMPYEHIDLDKVKAFFEENDLDWEGGHFTVRRVLSASGRSRRCAGAPDRTRPGFLC